MAEISIIKLGGSLVCPSSDKLVDFDYLAKFRDLIAAKTKTGMKFGITTGGGYIMRMYRDQLTANGVTNARAIHWMGTTCCNLHASIVAAYFQELADPGFIKFTEFKDPEQFKIAGSVKIAGAAEPGHSSDVDAVLFAQNSGASKIISLKNVDGVYTADPKKDPTATRVAKLTWDEYLNIIGNPTEHTPGGNFPVDPIASRMAKECGLQFVVVNGADLQNFANVLEGKEFVGTTIA